MEFNIRSVAIFITYFIIQLVKKEPVYLSIQLRYHNMQLRQKFISRIFSQVIHIIRVSCEDVTKDEQYEVC